MHFILTGRVMLMAFIGPSLDASISNLALVNKWWSILRKLYASNVAVYTANLH